MYELLVLSEKIILRFISLTKFSFINIVDSLFVSTENLLSINKLLLYFPEVLIIKSEFLISILFFLSTLLN